MGDNHEFKELNSRALVGTVDWDSGGRNEFILEPDSWYRITAASRANGNAIHFNIDWYEHAEITDNTN